MDSLTHKESTSNKECIRKLFTELKSFLIRKFHEFSKEHWIYLPGSLQILVSSFLVFGDLGCVIFFTMVSLCKARKARLLKMWIIIFLTSCAKTNKNRMISSFVPCRCFPLFNHYIHIPNIYLIWDFGRKEFVCP